MPSWRAMLVLIAACGGAPPPAAPPPPPPPPPVVVDAGAPEAQALDRDLPRLVERSLAMYRDVAAALEAAGTDCAAAITRLGALAPTYHDVAVANAKVIHDRRDAELRAALTPHDDELSHAAEAVMHAPTLSACANDRAFADALDRVFSP
jgi:hypothetical protein